MARTRSKPKPKPAPTKQPNPEPPTSTSKPLPPPTTNPPKLFVLPKPTSPDSRIVTLENPATGAPSRYYFCPDKAFYEFTRIAAPKKDCRSWLITPSPEEEEEEEEEEGGIAKGCVTKTADLFLATPMDILFFLLPALAPKSAAREAKQHFLSLEDHIDALCSTSRQWRILLAQYPSLKGMIEKRMAVVCDTVAAGDESMYRLSNEKLVGVLIRKAARMCAKGLPPSMEERFIKTALEVPVMNIQRDHVVTSTSALDINTEDVATSTSSETAVSVSQTTTLTRMESSGSTIESQTSTTSTTATSVTATETEEIVEPKPALSTPETIPPLLRLRTCLTYLSQSYLPPVLLPVVKSSPTPDFSSLDTHLSALSKLRAEALALRSISDNISRKRGYEDDDEKAAEREEKKRKKEEEEKKKKSESRAVKQLKKVDTSGMKKLSSFFTKAPKKA